MEVREQDPDHFHALEALRTIRSVLSRPNRFAITSSSPSQVCMLIVSARSHAAGADGVR